MAIEDNLPGAEPADRLLANYRRCLAWRLELWFPDQADLRWLGPRLLQVQRAGRVATLELFPELCRWRLVCGCEQLEGSFDRTTKRLRQLFS
jgi:hypothetical protein